MAQSHQLFKIKFSSKFRQKTRRQTQSPAVSPIFGFPMSPVVQMALFGIVGPAAAPEMTPVRRMCPDHPSRGGGFGLRRVVFPLTLQATVPVLLLASGLTSLHTQGAFCTARHMPPFLCHEKSCTTPFRLRQKRICIFISLLYLPHIYNHHPCNAQPQRKSMSNSELEHFCSSRRSMVEC